MRGVKRRARDLAAGVSMPTLLQLFWGPLANQCRRIATWRRGGRLSKVAETARRQPVIRLEQLEPRLLLSADLSYSAGAGALDATLRIIDQVRTRAGYTYDFAVEERRVTITIEGDAKVGFRVGARARHRSNGSEHTAAAEAATPREAVRAVAETWDQTAAPPLAFDWGGIEALLTQVHAI